MRRLGSRYLAPNAEFTMPNLPYIIVRIQRIGTIFDCRMKLIFTSARKAGSELYVNPANDIVQIVFFTGRTLNLNQDLAGITSGEQLAGDSSLTFISTRF